MIFDRWWRDEDFVGGPGLVLTFFVGAPTLNRGAET
jgi:hypothetical protein